MNKLTYVNGYGQQIEFPAFGPVELDAIRLDPDELNGGATDYLFEDQSPEEAEDE